jgi:uncharacterized protein (TIGR03437 family)
VVVDPAGNFYIADYYNVVRKVTPAGIISTVVGTGTNGFLGDRGVATSAELYHPCGVTLDAAGNMYIADSANNRIRKVDITTGTITTVAGNGTAGFSGDGAGAIFAELYNPKGVAVDSAGNLYIADTYNNRIRKVTNGKISTVAGNGVAAFAGDNGPAISASLNSPTSVVVDPTTGTLFIADYQNSRIRKVAPNGGISTIAGTGRFGFSGDTGPATSADLNFPAALALDSTGKIYFSDNQNQVVRLLTPPTAPASPAVGAVITASAFGASGAAAPGTWLEIYGTNLAPVTRLWTSADFTGITAPTLLGGTTVTIGGVPAYLSYASPGQLNALVPSGTGTGLQPLVVSTATGVSAAYSLTVNATQPALWAPQAMNIGGLQYTGALFSDYSAYALPASAIPGVATRPAKPGETIILYGVGFGGVTPSVTVGQITGQSNTLTGQLQISIGGAPATLKYSGLSVNSVGLYEFDVVVPNVAAANAVPVTFSLAGAQDTQTLYLAVGN